MKKFSKCDAVNTLAGRYDLKLHIKQILMSFMSPYVLSVSVTTVTFVDYGNRPADLPV
jgi:hypothetical protein